MARGSSYRRLIVKACATASVGALALGAAACGGGGDSGGDGAAAGKGGTLNVWVRGAGDSQKAYQVLFDKFTQQTGTKVKLFSTLTDFETKLNAAAAAHDLPDVVVDDAAQLGAFEQMGIVQEVDRNAIKGQENLTDAAWKSAQDVSGKYYAVPFSAQADLLFVRKDWLKKVGMKPPKTWDDMVKVAKAFTTEDPDGNGKDDTYGIVIPGSTERGYISWNWSTYLWQAGGDYVDDSGKPVINSPQAVQAAQWYEDLFCKDKVVQPGALNDVTDDTNKAWQTGVGGMYLTGPYAFATSDDSPVKGKYVVVPAPRGPAGSDVLAEGTDIYLMAGSDQESAAKQLAEFMITPEAQKLGMTAVPTSTIVRLPVNTSVDAKSGHDNDPRWKLSQQVYQDSAHYEPVSLPQWQKMRQAASDALNAMIAKCGDPATALGALNQKYADLLAQK